MDKVSSSLAVVDDHGGVLVYDVGEMEVEDDDDVSSSSWPSPKMVDRDLWQYPIGSTMCVRIDAMWQLLIVADF
ncbi:hypothetical protein DEO72_LG9g1405 [Vigna unguiculata]|uniref:Uncharacterized protein n=1 Tax=Vigna unguiculata TaxID=3917 RepID=A0A4D6MY66_VIGUN|nr:hypothetical protein DEO72_LG9g1405 [Vigna unguiculata]